VEKQAIFNVHALLKRFRIHGADVRETPEALGSKGFIPGAQRITASGILVPLLLGFIDPKRNIEYWSILVTCRIRLWIFPVVYKAGCFTQN
jgi:hypothetical protein